MQIISNLPTKNSCGFDGISMIAVTEHPSRSERGGFRETVYAVKYTGQLPQRRQRDTRLPATTLMHLQERLQRAVQMSQGSCPLHGSVLLHWTLCT